jgi:hypothetical protein
MNGKHNPPSPKGHKPPPPPHKGKHAGTTVDLAQGTVTLTLDATVAKDLLQALTLALGGGGGKTTKLSAAYGSKKPGAGGDKGGKKG